VTRSRVRERERIRAAVQTPDPAALAAYAGALRPVVTIRELEARIDAAAPTL